MSIVAYAEAEVDADLALAAHALGGGGARALVEDAGGQSCEVLEEVVAVARTQAARDMLLGGDERIVANGAASLALVPTLGANVAGACRADLKHIACLRRAHSPP